MGVLEAGMLIGRQIAIMFIILLIGAGCYMKGIISKDGTKQLSKIALYIVNPVLIFMSYQTEYSSRLLKGLAWSFLLSAVTFALAIILSMTAVHKNREDASLERFSAVYSNCGFIGIPLINGIFGTEGVLYLTAYVTLFNILVWTHGLMQMKGEKDFTSLLKALRSPSVIAVFLGLATYLTQIHLPEVPLSSLKYISDMNTPLAMLIAGASAAQTNFFKAMKNPGLYIVSALKLLVIPLICCVAMSFIPAPPLVIMVVTIACACPVATTGTMFAIMFDRKPLRCAEFFAFTTLLSAFTLPVVTMAAAGIVR